ncbi:MAG: hypothetical protein J0I06_05660 [Planctomycetes bacterium]|nr:hypothetical protein [Planctomycetota bacterium]
MNFTIVWSEAAIQDLARIWLNATDRNAITQASNEIDRVLGRDPLGFRFEVVVDDLRVTVGAVWVTRPV